MKKFFIPFLFLIGFNSQAQVVVDDPYAMRKLWIDIDPANFDMHFQNFLNVNFGLRGTYHLNGKTSVYSDFYVSYMDINKVLAKRLYKIDLNRFFKFETHFSYDFRNKVKEKKVQVVISQTSNYNDAYWSNSDKYTVTSRYIVVPAQIRKTTSYHGSVDLFRSSYEYPDGNKYANTFQPILSSGLSFKKMLNVKVRYGGAESLYFNNLYNTKTIDLLFSPILRLTEDGNSELATSDFKNLGWRFVYELKPFQKGKELNSNNLFQKAGVFYKFELGQRPGIKGYRAYFNFGMGWRLVDK